MKVFIKQFFIILFIILFSFFILSSQIQYTAKQIKKMAQDKVKGELQNYLNNKLGKNLDVDTCVKALYYLAKGNIKEAKKIVTEFGISKFMEYFIGSTAISVISAAWKFDIWIWESIKTWQKDLHRKNFFKEFLSKKINYWIRNDTFSPNKTRSRTFLSNLNTEFDAWFTKHWDSLIRASLYHDREAKRKKFKQELWGLMLRTIGELGKRSDLIYTCKKTRYAISKKIKNYENLIKLGVFQKGSIIQRFKSLLPQYLKAIYPQYKIKKIYVHDKPYGNGKYFVSWKWYRNEGGSWVIYKHYADEFPLSVIKKKLDNMIRYFLQKSKK